jgi:hypothetical protein
MRLRDNGSSPGRRCDIRVREIISLEQQWLAGRLCQRVAEAVTEIEPGRMPPLSRRGKLGEE